MNLEKALSILGLNPNFTEEELKSKYRILAKKYHPDLHDGNKQASEKMKEINEAKTYLENYLKSGGKRDVVNNHNASYDERSYIELREKYLRELNKYEIKSSKALNEKINEFKIRHNLIIIEFSKITRIGRSIMSLEKLFENTKNKLINSYNELKQLLLKELTKYVQTSPFIEEKEIVEICTAFMNTLKNKEFDSNLLEKYIQTIEKIKNVIERIKNLVRKYAQISIDSVIDKYRALFKYENIKQKIDKLKSKTLIEFEENESTFESITQANDFINELSKKLEKEIEDIINKEKELEEYRRKKRDEIEALEKSTNYSNDINFQEIISSINMAKSKSEINTIVENTKNKLKKFIYESCFATIITKMISHAERLISLSTEIKEVFHISKTLSTVLNSLETIKNSGEAQRFLDETCADIDFEEEESLFLLASILAESQPDPAKEKAKILMRKSVNKYSEFEEIININDVYTLPKEELIKKLY